MTLTLRSYIHVRSDRYPLSGQISPTAVLDCFVGNAQDVDAPEWTRESMHEHVFVQPRASFADLFARLALSDENLSQVRLF